MSLSAEIRFSTPSIYQKPRETSYRAARLEPNIVARKKLQHNIFITSNNFDALIYYDNSHYFRLTVEMEIETNRRIKHFSNYLWSLLNGLIIF